MSVACRHASTVLGEKPWTNQALQDQEEALAPVRAEVLKRAGSSHEASTGVKSTAGLEQRNLRNVSGFSADAGHCRPAKSFSHSPRISPAGDHMPTHFQ